MQTLSVNGPLLRIEYSSLIVEPVEHVLNVPCLLRYQFESFFCTFIFIGCGLLDHYQF